MKLALLFLTAVAALSGRVTATRLAPEASVWFEPNHGQVKGRTEFVGRTGGAFFCLTGSAVVNSLLSAKIEHKATMRDVTTTFVGAQADTHLSPESTTQHECSVEAWAAAVPTAG